MYAFMFNKTFVIVNVIVIGNKNITKLFEHKYHELQDEFLILQNVHDLFL